jgi:DNA modification methylase
VTARFLVADIFDGLATLEDGSVDLVVTSPPFLALRSYLPADHPDKGKEIGSESTPAEFIDTLLRVTAELRRVLAPHGSICVELGDTYAGSGGAGGDYQEEGLRTGQPLFDGSARRNAGADLKNTGNTSRGTPRENGWPLAKSRTLIPSLYQIALAYGFNPLTGQPSPAGQWRVRNVVTWARPNPPVGALGDKWRPATSDLVVACVSPKRYWDDLATRHDHKEGLRPRRFGEKANSNQRGLGGDNNKPPGSEIHPNASGAPLLDYWVIPPTGYTGAHYAVFPPELVEPCVKAMCPQKVCVTCGEPSRRITETTNAVGVSTGRRSWREDEETNSTMHTGEHTVSVSTTPTAERVTLGWTECGHGVDCRATTWQWLEIPVEQGRVRGGKWIDLEKWELPVEPTETRIKIKRRRVVDDLGECADPSHWRPGLILDPFAGSGTTLSVATGHGHDAIGIDINARNADLSRNRVGPFLFEMVGVVA